MRPKVTVFLLLSLALTPLARAQQATLSFPAEGDRLIWVSAAMPKSPPTDAVKTGKPSYNVDVSGHKPTDTVFVLDEKTGNIAAKQIKDFKPTGWELADADNQYVANVKVHLEHAGKPVAVAQVALTDGKNTQNQLLDSSAKGDALFFGVKAGQLKVKVDYRSGGTNAEPVLQLFDLSAKRTDAVPTFSVSLPKDVETVGANAPVSSDASASGTPVAPTGASPNAPPARRGSVFGTILSYLIGIVLVGTVAWFLIAYAKNNPGIVGSKLEQLGVQIPKPQDDALANPAPAPMPKAPEPPQKIILSGAAPDLTTPVVSSTAVTQPRLLSDTGDELPIPEGELMVGRDLGLGLSLPGESTVSRNHAQLHRSGNEVVLNDLGSTNGTFVNGTRVQANTVLRPGDLVQFGAVRFRYEV